MNTFVLKMTLLLVK